MNVDKLFKSINKKQRYLFFRFFVYTLMLILSFRPVIYEHEPSYQYLLNSVIFLFLPLFIEYIWGMQTYCKGANFCRFIGIGYTFVIVFFAAVGLMGGYSIADIENNIILKSSSTGIIINIELLKYTVYITPCLLLFDLIFAFTRSEIILYEVEEKILDKFNELNEINLEIIEKSEKMKLLKILQQTGGSKNV